MIPLLDRLRTFRLGDPRFPRRLVTRLSLSHFAPLLLLASALALLLAALLKVSAVLGSLKDNELETLRDEGALHRAMWDLDVAMRHAHDDCRNGGAGAGALEAISRRAAVLAEAVKAAPAGAPMLKHAHGYLALSQEASVGRACDVLTASANELRREKLDENLTNLWVSRLQLLHDAVSEREETARATGVAASRAGIGLTAAAVMLAVLLVRRMARSFSGSLLRLAGTARRVGDGDLSTPVPAEGPDEIRQVCDELERMREQLSRLESAKQSFLASVSHELRTPLSMIREALVLLDDGVVGPLGPRQARVLNIARQACEREIRMVSTLLDLSRFRAGNPLRVREGTSLDAVIDAAARDEQAQAESRGVEVRVVHEGAAPRMAVDPVLLERAIANLIRNAVSVSRRGDPVTVHRGLTADGVVITVSDRGPGVPEPIRKTVFDAFVTHPLPQSGKALGVGLGLALAREIVRAHGGDLVLDASAQQGATFRLRLPLGSAERAASAPEVNRVA